jgi:hypothetical protein
MILEALLLCEVLAHPNSKLTTLASDRAALVWTDEMFRPAVNSNINYEEHYASYPTQLSPCCHTETGLASPQDGRARRLHWYVSSTMFPTSEPQPQPHHVYGCMMFGRGFFRVLEHDPNHSMA